MTCKEGFIVTIVSSTPELEDSWNALKGSKQLADDFGIGSEVFIDAIAGDEANVHFKSESGPVKFTVPLSCLSCHIEPGSEWEGTNKDLKPAPSEDEVAGAVPVIVPGQRVCSTCGATASDMDMLCVVCGSKIEDIYGLGSGEELGLENVEPVEVRACASCGTVLEPDATKCNICDTPITAIPIPIDTEDASEELLQEDAPEPAEERACPSCGAFVDEDATECMICETPMAAVPIVALKEVTLKEVPAEIPEEPEPILKEPMVEKEMPAPEILEEEEIPKEELPEPAEERACPSCGALVDADATECAICETLMAAVPIVALKEVTVKEVPAEIPEEPTPEFLEKEELPEEYVPAPVEERVCPSCGAFVDDGATECMICETPIAAVPIVALKEITVEKIPEEPVPEIEVPKEAPAEERVCPSCGAFADPDATECMICDTSLGEAPLTEPLQEVGEPLEAIDIPESAPYQRVEEVPVAEEPLEEAVVIEEEPALMAEEPAIDENVLICPSCSKAIPPDSTTCPECWTDLSLYVKCQSCGLLSPAGEKLCRECFAPLAEFAEEEEEPISAEEFPDVGPNFVIHEEVEIPEDLKEEMTQLEVQEEQGRECLVCGAIFGPADETYCPICGIEFGIEVEEPKIPETIWENIEIEVSPTIRTCPNCGTNVTGLDATEREVNEGRWFYRGLVTIFAGIFFTSFSIYARGISVENRALEMDVPPTDVLLSVIGWILVLVGFTFWFLSLRLHDQRSECPECGIETEKDMSICINCGTDLGLEPEEEAEEETIDESLLPMEEELLAEEAPAEPAPEKKAPAKKAPVATKKVPEAEPPAVIEEESVPVAEEPLEEAPEDLQVPEPHFIHGEELPVEHEEHKKCPGCGIFVDLGDKICPVCDTEFAPEPIPDAEIEVLSEDDELANLAIDAESSIDDAMLPDSSRPHVECPSCGADLEAGTKQCPVCEYPME